MTTKEVYQEVVAQLDTVGLPVSFQEYTGSEKTYLTYFFYNEAGELHADDQEILTGYYVQVDLWTDDGDYHDLADAVVAAMVSAGYIRRNGADLYESNTKTHHKAMRFYKEVG